MDRSVGYFCFAGIEFVPEYAEGSRKHLWLFRNVPIKGIQDTPLCCYVMFAEWIPVDTKERLKKENYPLVS